MGYVYCILYIVYVLYQDLQVTLGRVRYPVDSVACGILYEKRVNQFPTYLPTLPRYLPYLTSSTVRTTTTTIREIHDRFLAAHQSSIIIIVIVIVILIIIAVIDIAKSICLIHHYHSTKFPFIHPFIISALSSFSILSPSSSAFGLSPPSPCVSRLNLLDTKRISFSFLPSPSPSPSPSLCSAKFTFESYLSYEIDMLRGHSPTGIRGDQDNFEGGREARYM